MACSDLALGFGVGQDGWSGLVCRQEAPVTGARSALLGSGIWAAGSLSPLGGYSLSLLGPSHLLFSALPP